MRTLTFLARRFVAGETADDALKVVRSLNRQGLKASLDLLGEEVSSVGQAEACTREIVELFDRVHRAKADCNVSIKLTQLGLNLDPVMARHNLELVLDAAAAHDNFVRLDMEGSPYTQKTLDVFHSVWAKRRNLGVVIQSYLRRSAGDIEALCKKEARVRLCKGAYKETPGIAFPEKVQVNRSFDQLALRLLEKGEYPAIATHDDARIQAAQEAARRLGRGKETFEFQMLYGLRPRRWAELVREGHNVRIYVPYGTHWLPYYYRRLRERKENVLFVLRNLLWG